MNTLTNRREGLAFNPEARADIIRRRQAGEPFTTIGASYGVSRERIRQLCKRWGAESPIDNTRADAQAVAEGIALVESGMPVATAAARVGINAGTLRRYVADKGLDIHALAAERSAHLYDGRRFGFWSVLPGGHRKIDGTDNDRELECVCTCGTRRWVRLTNLVGGTSRGCGCRNRTGQRQRTPWICQATGERAATSAELARLLGVGYMGLVRRRNRGETYTDAQGRTWEPDAEAAVPHNTGTPWLCIQTKETWPSARAMAAHLGISLSALTQAIHKGLAYSAIDGRHYCPVGREEELIVRPRHPNSGNALAPQGWVCEETGEQWSSRSALERHLGLGDHGLARKGRRFTAADGRTYSRVEAEE